MQQRWFWGERGAWRRLWGLVALTAVAWMALAPRVAGAVDIAWTQIAVPGPVADAGAGPAGQVWITLRDDRIFRWDGAGFVQVDGAATRVAVGTSAGAAAVVNRNGDGFIRTGNGWQHEPRIAGATDIGFGPNGGIWFTNTAGEVVVLQPDSAFTYRNLDAVRIAVDGDLNPWIVRRDGGIAHRLGGAGGTFQPVTGLAQDIAIGANGAVWVLGTNGSPYRWTGTAWDMGPGLGTQITIASDGSPWVVTGAGTLFRGATGGQGAPPPPPAQTTGPNRPVLALLCRFADVPGTYDFAADRIGAMFTGDQSLDGWVREMSYGQINFAGSRGSGWHVLPKNRAAYLSGDSVPLDNVSQDCAAAAQAAGVDLSPYFYFAVFLNDEIGANIQGRAGTIGYQIGGQQKQVPTVLLSTHGITSPALVLHEFGHLWGGQHTESRIDPLGGGSYMGDNPKQPKWPLPLKSANSGPGFHAFNRDLMGWVPAARKARFAGGTQQFTLTRLTQPAADGSLMVEVPFGTGGSRYTVEARTRIGFDAATQYPDFQVCAGCFSATQFGFVIPTEGVYIHRIDNPNGDPASVPVLSQPGGDPNSAAGVWLTGQTYTDTANNLTIRIDRFDANGAQITVTGPGAAAPPPPAPAATGNQPADTLGAAGLVTLPATLGPLSTAAATEEGGEPRPCGTIGKTLWVRFTATAAGPVTVDTEGSSFDTVLAVYRSAGAATGFAALTLVECNDDTGASRQSRVTFTAAANETIYVQAGGYNGATGDLRLRLAAGAP